MQDTHSNPLATAPVGKLIVSYAVPATISTLVGALYNIVDQIFIGRGVGVAGNAATNVSFPLTTIFTAISLLIGIGSAANFNLRMGEGKKDEAKTFIGNGLTFMVLAGVICSAIAYIFLGPLLKIMGGANIDKQVYDYAIVYTQIICVGLPFLVFTTASSPMIRADGSSKTAMFCVLVGAVINTVLDPIFIFVFGWGIQGAAWATVIGQMVSAIVSFVYMKNYFKSFVITKDLLKPNANTIIRTVSIGASAAFNQLALLAMQIVMNNVLSYYGQQSKYGAVIPLAAVGIITKVNFIFLSVSIGIAQGSQPIFGYNYGAKNYHRVKETLRKTATINLTVGTLALICFQVFPRQIIGFFGTGEPAYFEFATRYFRIYMLFTITNGLMPLFGNLFSSIGKPLKGIFVTLTRQFIFLIPLLIILPKYMGIDGVMYAGPIADCVSLITALFFVTNELRDMTRLENDLVGIAETA